MTPTDVALTRVFDQADALGAQADELERRLFAGVADLPAAEQPAAHAFIAGLVADIRQAIARATGDQVDHIVGAALNPPDRN